MPGHDQPRAGRAARDDRARQVHDPTPAADPVREVQVGVLPLQFVRLAVPRQRRLHGIVELAEPDDLALVLNASAVSSGLLIVPDAPETCGPAWGPMIAGILRPGAVPHVAFAIVQAVLIDMIDDHPFRRLHDDPMHQDTFAVLAPPDGIRGVFTPTHAPFVLAQLLEILRVHERELPLRQWDAAGPIVGRRPIRPDLHPRLRAEVATDAVGVDAARPPRRIRADRADHHPRPPGQRHPQPPVLRAFAIHTVPTASLRHVSPFPLVLSQAADHEPATRTGVYVLCMINKCSRPGQQKNAEKIASCNSLRRKDLRDGQEKESKPQRRWNHR